MAHKIIGIDVGDKEIRVSKIIPNNKGFDVDVSKTIDIEDENYLDTLKTVFEEEKNSFFVMGVKDLNVYKRSISLPFTDKSKVLKVLPFQIEQRLPLKMDDIFYDYSLIKDKVNKVTNIQTFILKKDRFNTIFKKIEENNLKLRALLPDSLSYRYLYNTLDVEKAVFLDIGAKNTRFLIFDNEKLISDSTILMGGNNIDSVIAETFDVELSMAKVAKEKINKIFEYETTQDESSLIIEKIIKEKIDNILDIIRIEIKRVNLEEGLPVYLLGGGALINNIAQYIETKLNLRVKTSNLWSNPLYAKSIGYALRETSYIKDCRINFLKDQFTLKSSESSVITKNIWIYLFYLVVLVGLFFTKEKLVYDSLQDKITKIEDNTQRISKKLIKDDFYDPSELLSIVSGSESSKDKIIPNKTALDHLSNISKLLLDAKIKVDVKDINIAKKQISITTFVDTIEVIDKLVDALHKDKCYKNIKKGNSKKNKKTGQTRIKLTINNLDC